MPVVSVAMCTFNGALFLREQLDSILQQDHVPDEIVVGDDASTDSTRDILVEYAHRHPGRFVLHFHPAGLGAIGNFEFVLGRCRGDIVFLSDQDDVWRPDKVTTMLRAFDDPRCLLLFTDGELIDAEGRPLGSTLWAKWDFGLPRRLYWRWIVGGAVTDLSNNINKVTGATVALRRSLLTQLLPIQVPPAYWHDAWFALHAAARGGLRFLSKPLISYRVHAAQQVGLTRGGGSNNAAAIPLSDFLSRLRMQYPKYAGYFGGPGLGTRLKNSLNVFGGR